MLWLQRLQGHAVEQIQRLDGDPEKPFLRTRAVIASGLINPEMLGAFVPGDVLAPAHFYVQRAVSFAMEELVDVKLLWDSEDERGRLHLVPTSLLGALWLQFAQAITGNKDYRRCARCNTWFELSPEASRTNKLYCSDACKMKSYRDRQAEARRLHGQGLEPKKIAKKIGSELDTVSGWIEPKQQEKASSHRPVAKRK